MRGLSPELRVIFGEEFRRQIRNRGFVFFTVLILALMLIAIPLTPVVVGLIQDDTADAGAPRDVGAEVLERIGYADPAGILPGHEQQGAPERYNEPAEGILAVQQGEIDTLFVLTADYLDSGLVEQYWASRESGGRFSGNWATEGAFRGFLRFQLDWRAGRRRCPSACSRTRRLPDLERGGQRVHHRDGPTGTGSW